jgi:hypothetical protein
MRGLLHSSYEGVTCCATSGWRGNARGNIDSGITAAQAVGGSYRARGFWANYVEAAVAQRSRPGERAAHRWRHVSRASRRSESRASACCGPSTRITPRSGTVGHDPGAGHVHGALPVRARRSVSGGWRARLSRSGRLMASVVPFLRPKELARGAQLGGRHVEGHPPGHGRRRDHPGPIYPCGDWSSAIRPNEEGCPRRPPVR